MLSESERETLREIQRKLSGDDPDFVRYFQIAEPHPPVVGLNVLTDTQISARTVPPAPRRRTK